MVVWQPSIMSGFSTVDDLMWFSMENSSNLGLLSVVIAVHCVKVLITVRVEGY